MTSTDMPRWALWVIRVASTPPYVAIPRAIKSCYWYVDRKEAKTRALEKASRYIDESADFWDVDPRASLRVITAPVVKKFGAKPWSGSRLRR